MRLLNLTYDQLGFIVSQARNDVPNETCGFMAGQGNIVERIIPIPNASDHPATHYVMEPNALLNAYKAIESSGLELLGVYHSHPQSEPIPSEQDVSDARRNLPDLAYLIVGLAQEKPEIQVWYITEQDVQRVELLVGNSPVRQALPLSPAQIMSIVIATLTAVAVLLLVSFNLLPPAPPIPTP